MVADGCPIRTAELELCAVCHPPAGDDRPSRCGDLLEPFRERTPASGPLCKSSSSSLRDEDLVEHRNQSGGTRGHPVGRFRGSGEHGHALRGERPQQHRFCSAGTVRAACRRFFQQPGYDAQVRVVEAFDRALRSHDDEQPVVFAGHGAVGTLLKCALGGRAIRRSEDQGKLGNPGGGNIWALRLKDRALLCDWTPMEQMPATLDV